MEEIWAIILAAGESKRMGFPKMLLTLDGKTMLEKVIENVTKSNVDNTLVVLGAERDKLEELVVNSGVKYCYNDNYKQGMLSSVKCGFGNIPSDCKAVLVFQGDQPLILPEVINMVIDAYNSSEKEIVIPVCEMKRGHPLMIGRKYHSKIGNLKDEEGLRTLAYKYSDDVLEVNTNDNRILFDIDIFEDYKKEIKQKF